MMFQCYTLSNKSKDNNLFLLNTLFQALDTINIQQKE